MPEIVQNNLIWFVGGAITLLGLFVYGLGDLLRLSLYRAWAISSVAFSESLRRRVLWITPLAILGVIVISQLQVPSDEQDAIRQTVKFCLFASGMVVTILGMILACTNLPKEIENRVIFTIVTKPTTRLEIVIGKIIGFAKVSLAVLLIMGLFSFGYLHFRAWQLRSQIVDRLQSGSVDPLSRATDEYYANAGLLTARSLELPQMLNVLADEPKPDDTTRTFFGNGDGDMLVPFELKEDQFIPPGLEQPFQAGVLIYINLGYEKSAYGQSAAPATGNLPVGVAAPASTRPAAPGAMPEHADVQLTILDSNLNTLIDTKQISSGSAIQLFDPTGEHPAIAVIPPASAQALMKSPRFFIDVQGVTGGVKFRANVAPTTDPRQAPVKLAIIGNPKESSILVGPAVDPRTPEKSFYPPQFRSRLGLGNQFQLRGGDPKTAPVGIFHFNNAQAYRGGKLGFELRTTLETNYSDRNDESATRTEITIVNRTTGQHSPAVTVYPENNRTTFFDVPAEYAGNGNFDVLVRNLSDGHYVGLGINSLSMVSSTAGFDLNFAKSLLIIWMLSLLVVIISIFCSTFLSWPIAIVLSLLLLLGHWGVVQLGDTLAPGIGNQVVTDFFGNNTSAGQAKAVSNSVEALAKILNNIGAVLPDINDFSSIDQIEKGLIIPGSQLWAALRTLLAFGVPTMVLSYVLLRNKEVAP